MANDSGPNAPAAAQRPGATGRAATRKVYTSGDFNRGILEERTHRPWPMPARPWIMTQTWHDLLFAHWPLAPEVLGHRIPGPVQLDLFDGRAWIGIVSFYMTNVAARWTPALPGVSAFPEVNVRTYVRVADQPGVFFFSLDAGSRLAVWAARWALNLPYYFASMTVETFASDTEYRSSRAAQAEWVAGYRPAGPVFHASPGSLEYFLTERYALYALDRGGRPYRLQIHHPPWPLQPAEAEIGRNTMAEAAGLALADTAPLLHFSKRQDMVAWPPERIGR